jgi:hypothetical protein
MQCATCDVVCSTAALLTRYHAPSATRCPFIIVIKAHALLSNTSTCDNWQ